MIAVLVARNTFREATRDRVIAGVIGAGLVLLLATQVLSPLAMGEGERLTVDLGLSGISLLGILVTLLVGTSLVAKEIERRTIYNLLSRPIARPHYLLGKWIGMTATLWVVAGGLGLALWGLLLVRGYGPNALSLLQSVYLAGLELALVAALAVMFSALSTPVLSALYTLGAVLIGQWSDDLRAYSAKLPGALAPVLHAAANLVPNLPLFNMRTLAANGETTTLLHLGLASAYALVYCACVLSLAAAAFESRDFK
jgi:ABC-type transport system involved in multi-copper enzyme maturation permease subunit